MAYYDTEEDKIYGCEEGTYTYRHEQGHKKLHNTKYGGNLQVIQHYSIFAILIFLCFQRFIIAIGFLSVAVVSEIIDEVYAHIYAIKN